MFKVKFYKDKQGNEPVYDYLKELDKKAKTSKNERILLQNIWKHIKILRAYGTRAGMPYIEHIEGDIWQLRPLDNRVFFFYLKGDIKAFILLHHFTKKTNKTPPREIEQAKRNMLEVIERSKEYE